MSEPRKKILIVEDSKEFLMALKFVLDEQGFDVVSTEDGKEALEIVKREKPDLILSDIVMPKMDGLTMAKGLREAKIEVPIIFLTNLLDVKHMSDALQAGIEIDFIEKSNMSVNGIVDKVKRKLLLK